MVCESCNGPLGASRDRICLGCAAVNTIKEELRSEWPSASLRALGTDLLVSCSRHIRAIRVTSVRAYAEAEERGRFEAKAEAKRSEAPEDESRARGAGVEDEESYEYSEDESAEAVEPKRERSRTPAGISAKTKAGPPAEVKLVSSRDPIPSEGDKSGDSRLKKEAREALPRKAPGDNRNLKRHRRDDDEERSPRPRRRTSRGKEAEEIQLHQRHLVLQDEREPQRRRPGGRKRWRRRY